MTQLITILQYGRAIFPKIIQKFWNFTKRRLQKTSFRRNVTLATRVALMKIFAQLNKALIYWEFVFSTYQQFVQYKQGQTVQKLAQHTSQHWQAGFITLAGLIVPRKGPKRFPFAITCFANIPVCCPVPNFIVLITSDGGSIRCMVSWCSERRYIEAVVQRCSVKKVFLEISQNLQENTCVRVCFLIKLQAGWGLQLY